MNELEEIQEDETIPDDALEEIACIAPKLNIKERAYIYWRSLATPPIESMKRAGYKGKNWRMLETRPVIRTAMQDLQEQLAPEYRITRERVVGLIMEGIDIARRKDQSKNIIDGAVALANISGVGAAQKLQVQQHTTTVTQQEQTPKALRHTPKEGLEKLVGVERVIPGKVPIEGEFTLEKTEPRAF